MTRIERRFAELKREGRAGLVTFITAGDPDYETSLAILKALPGAGADIIELGMPFSDPMADGPAIQASSQRALKSGQTMKKTLADGQGLPRRRCHHPHSANGLLQPHICVSGGSLHRRCSRRPEQTV